MRQRTILVLVLAAALFGAFPLLSSSRSAAQEATPAAAECPPMTEEEQRAVVTQFLTALSSGDDVAAAELAAEGVAYHAPSKGKRQGDGEGFLRGQRASFPDATMTIDLLVAEGDHVAAYVTWSGTLAGEAVRVSGQDVSIPEGQRDAEWVGAIFFRIECGTITEVRPVIDRLGHLMDLGVISQEDLQSAEPIATPAP